MRAAVWIALAAGIGVAGCRLGEPAPAPLRGDAPAAVVVWPLLDRGHDASRELLLEDLGAAMGQRGYRVIPFRVASASLDGLAASEAMATPEALGRSLAADAVLQLVVRDFAATGMRPLRDARWDLEWKLVSLRGQGLLWSWTSRGSWQPRAADFGDPHRALDAEPMIVPIGGDPRVTFRDASELVASLHRLALSHLPAGSR